MIIRIALLLVGFGLVAYVIIQLYSMYRVNSNLCEVCDGDGFWRGTRGEKNPCRACGGSGKNE